MRLDRFITHPSRDILMLLAGHMDVRALFRLGKVSKRLQKYAVDGNHIYLSMLHTFPGIKNLPQGKRDEYYTDALSRFYDQIIRPPSHEFDIYHIIGREMTNYPKNGVDPDDFKRFVSNIMVTTFLITGLTKRYKGREILIRQIQGWKNELKLHPVTPLRDHQIETILDHVSSIVISNFCFKELNHEDIHLTFIDVEFDRTWKTDFSVNLNPPFIWW